MASLETVPSWPSLFVEHDQLTIAHEVMLYSLHRFDQLGEAVGHVPPVARIQADALTTLRCEPAEPVVLEFENPTLGRERSLGGSRKHQVPVGDDFGGLLVTDGISPKVGSVV